MSDGLKFRTAKAEDAEALLKIYAPYVKDTAISFEYEVPSVEEFGGRIARTLERYPYIVAEKDGVIMDMPMFPLSMNEKLMIGR